MQMADAGSDGRLALDGRICGDEFDEGRRTEGRKKRREEGTMVLVW